jgi:3-dehydroquinate synthase
MTVSVPVALEGHAYEVVIGPGLMDRLGGLIAPHVGAARLAVVSDETVWALHGARLADSLAGAGLVAAPIVLAPGEQEKSFAGLERLCDRLLALELERGDLVIAFGGGVVGDLAGFAAAILKRGVDHLQIPTTLLAQVDSSVGGKTAIDTPRGKNLIGAFHQPRHVYADLDALSTLPGRELRCGYAEILKYGLIGDANFFAWLERCGGEVLSRDETALEHAVRRSVEMKAAIVAADEREGGVRALLNLGHTFAHALEAETNYEEALKHGEAVGVGCALAFRLSVRLGLCPPEDASRAEAAIGAAGLPVRLSELCGHPFAADRLLARMAQDKKACGGELTFILARGIGEAFVARGVGRSDVAAFLVGEGASP